MKIPNFLQSAAFSKPEGLALEVLAVSGGGAAFRLTYAELLRDVVEAAGQVQECLANEASSLPRPCRVGLVGPSSAAWVVALHALGWLGIEAVLLPARGPASELKDAFLAAPKLCAVWLVAGASSEAAAALEGETLLWRGTPAPRAGATLSKNTSPPPERMGELSEICAWVRSSGTTATPHFVPLTLAQIYFAAVGSAERLGHLPADIWLHTLPLEHVGGLSILYRAVLFAVTVRLTAPFSAAVVASQLTIGEIALVSLVPQTLLRVLEAWPDGAQASRSLRAVLVGGGPSSNALLARARACGLPVVATWGMTETAAQVATSRPQATPSRAGVGAPLIHARIRAHHDSSYGEVLEVWAAGMDKPLVTRDLGFVDKDGLVHVLGRADDLIISAGQKILPREVERVLDAHPAVRESCVVGREDPRWGMRPIAYVVLQSGSKRPSNADLQTYCRKSLASYKSPTQFNWCEELPRDQLGKLRRRSIK